MKLTLVKTLTIVALSIPLLTATQFVATPAMADDPVEVYCFEYYINGIPQLECDTVANFKAECALTDPNEDTEFCFYIDQLRFAAVVDDFTVGEIIKVPKKKKR